MSFVITATQKALASTSVAVTTTTASTAASASASATTKKSMSGLQREILALYRTVLRTAFEKDKTATTTTTTISTNNNYNNNNTQKPTCFVNALNDTSTNVGYAKEEFKRQSSLVKKNDFRTIEFKIRHGYKQVKLLQMPGVKKIVGGGGSGNGSGSSSGNIQKIMGSGKRPTTNGN